MGRQRKPTHLKLIEGTRDRRPLRLRKCEANAKKPLRAPPDWFNNDLIASWNFALDHAPRGLLKEIDRALLTSWVIAEYIHQRASRQLLASQLLIKSPNGSPIQSPLLGIINRQVVLMKAIAAEMGFSPAARTRVIVEAETDEDDEIARRYFRD